MNNAHKWPFSRSYCWNSRSQPPWPPWPDLLQIAPRTNLLLTPSNGAHCIHLCLKCGQCVTEQEAARPPGCKPLIVPECGEKKGHWWQRRGFRSKSIMFMILDKSLDVWDSSSSVKPPPQGSYEDWNRHAFQKYIAQRDFTNASLSFLQWALPWTMVTSCSIFFPQIKGHRPSQGTL